MEVTTNGFPKSGNHALVKAIQLLGVPCHVDHLPFGEEVCAKHVFIKRDPRNIICSWLRFQGMPVTPGMFIAAFRKFQEKSLLEELVTYEPWLTDENTLVVKYEDLIQSDATLRKIADYLGTPYIEGAFENLPGMTRTWYAEHSDYQTIWTPEVASVWFREGGFELLSTWGY